MGIVLRETFKNTVTFFLSILLGALNTLVLYVNFLDPNYYGLILFLVSTAFILKPLMIFGVNQSLIKFFSLFKDEKEKSAFLIFSLWFPLFFIIPLGLSVSFFYESICKFFSEKANLIENHVPLIFLIAFSSAYFEIFYTWAKVHLRTVFGNILKEFFIRFSISILLFLVHFQWIDAYQFIFLISICYVLQMLIMMTYAFRLYFPLFKLIIPSNFKEIVKYNFYVVLLGTVTFILLDIDKFMIPQKELMKEVAFYVVAVYIGSIVEVPGRAMHQIVQPLTAKLMNRNDRDEILKLYQKTSINLLIISGLIFILVNSNIEAMYQLLPKEYSGVTWIVFMTSVGKLYHMFLGNGGAIILNSKYYRFYLPYSILMVISVIVLNDWLIGLMKINGAALSTLIVILIFNTIKLGYVKYKLDIQPTTSKTWWVLSLISVFTVLGMCFDFDFPIIVNIVLKSVVLSILYVLILLKFNLSEDFMIFYEKLKYKASTFFN